MVEDKDKTADDIADRIVEALTGHSKEASVAAFTEVRVNVELQKEKISALEKMVYSEHHPVFLWARGFMETYKGTWRIVLASGAITIIGLLVQLYYLLQKGK